MYSTKSYSQMDESVLEELFNIQNISFERPYNKESFLKRFEDNKQFLSLHTYYNSQIVAYKTGYKMDDTLFYSWIGGVDPNYRRQGLAQALMDRQHQQLKQMGFLKVETKTQGHNRPMLMANLKSGFNITKAYHEEGRGLQVILQKDL